MAADVTTIYNNIAHVLKAYKSPYALKNVSDKRMDLYIEKEMTLLGKAYKEMFIASAIIQKGYVSFHFFPMYMNPKLGEKIPAELKKCLKGKTCFHIKKDDPQLIKQIDETLKLGTEFFKQLAK